MKDENEKPELTDQQKRERIPTVKDIPTMYRPCLNMVMLIPLPEIEKIGEIIIPERARMQLNEGHVVALGPLCQSQLEIGDCVTWDENTENRFDIDGTKFVLVNESQIPLRIKRAELEAAAAKAMGISLVREPQSIPPSEQE